MVAQSQLKPNQGVGQQLKARRTALRLSLAQIEIDTKIRGKFLTALESGEYDKLPNDIYSRGFVQHYASHLGLDGNVVAAAYAKERGGVAAGATQRPQLDRTGLVFTGPIVAALSAAVVVVVILGYLLLQLSALAAAPHLAITTPAADTALTGAVVTVSGNATPGSDVSINDSPVLSDTNGNFSQQVALQNGVNAIHVVAKSKLSKSTQLTRNVLAHLPQLANNSVLPAASFAGVAIRITAKRATAITTQIDDGDAVELLVPAGWSKVLTGHNVILLTCSDAGAIDVVITNSTVAGKDLGPLGTDGQVRRNQPFGSTTNFGTPTPAPSPSATPGQ